MEATNQFASARSCETAPCQSSLKPERAGVTFIYALRDPSTLEIRYIGKADEPEHRFRMHLWGIKWERNHKANWIRSLVKEGLQPILEIIDEVAQAEWQAAEAAYISFYKDEGCNLTNGSPGGDGSGNGEDNPNFGVKSSPEKRAKIGAANRGRRHTPETLAKMRAIKTGKKFSPETCARMSKALAGKRKSLEHRAKLRMAQTGKKASIETRLKLQRVGTGRKASPETLAKLSRAKKGERHWNFGKRTSPETAAKLSKALRGRRKSAEHRAKIGAALRRRHQVSISY